MLYFVFESFKFESKVLLINSVMTMIFMFEFNESLKLKWSITEEKVSTY